MIDRTEVNLGGSDMGNRLSDAGFSVFHGWDEELAEGLREHSLESAIKAATPRDYKERFVDTTSAQAWFEKREKLVYALQSEHGLAGIIWFSSEAYQTAEKTFAVRLYSEAQGRNLSTPFGQIAHRHLSGELGYGGDVWLETGASNITAQHLFRRLSYEFHPDPETEPGRVKMIRPGITTLLESREEQP